MAGISRRTLNLFLATAPLAGALAGQSAVAQTAVPPASKPRFGGTLTFVTTVEAARIVPLDNPFSPEFSGKITEGLITFDNNFNPQPELATSWQISDDGLEYVFNLRKGVKWHDGKDFTAEDVAFSLATIQKLHPRGRLTLANIEEFIVIDPHTVKLKLSKPAPYLFKALLGMETPIAPKHIYDGTDIANNPASRAPIGTGPFIFREWVTGSHVLLERNPDYWDKPKPYLDRIIVRFIPDPAARTTAFETGEVDIGGFSPIPSGDIDRLLASNKSLAVEASGYDWWGYLNQAVLNLDTEPFKKKEVRHAIAHAIDINAVLNAAWYGRGRLSPTAISPALREYHDPQYKHYAYDPSGAEKLLEQAGYPRKADGYRFPLRISYNPFLDGTRRTAEYITQALRKIGIDAQLRRHDYATFVRTVYTDRTFDISVENILNAFDPTVGVQRAYWSKNFKPGVPFSNGSHYVNPDVDRLLEAAATENDASKRKEYFYEFQKITYEELPIINLIGIEFTTIYNKKVKGHDVTIDGVSANFANVYIEE